MGRQRSCEIGWKTAFAIALPIARSAATTFPSPSSTRCAHLFARACCYLAKTDRLDLRLLALMAASLHSQAEAPRLHFTTGSNWCS